MIRLFAMLVVALFCASCARISSSTSGAGETLYQEEGIKFVVIHSESEGKRTMYGVIGPVDFTNFSYLIGPFGVRGHADVLVYDHRTIEFPEGSNFAVIPRKGDVKFLKTPLEEFCPDIESGRGVRYGLNIDALKKSPIWEADILPAIRKEPAAPAGNH